jgi:hypothetical protein
MSYVATLPGEVKRLDAAKIIDILNAEIAFYRERQMSIYYSAMLAQVLVVTGDRVVKGLPRHLATGTYGVFFLCVAFFAVLLGRSYTHRIWTLRERRAELLEACGLTPSPLPPHRAGSRDSPSWFYAILVILLSLVGAVLTIFGSGGAS